MNSRLFLSIPKSPYLLPFLLAGVVLIFSTQCFARDCESLFVDSTTRYLVSSDVVVHRSEVSEYADLINLTVGQFLRIHFEVPSVESKAILRATREIVRHALQNGIQHGSKLPYDVPIQYKITFIGERISVEIRSPQIKPFPEYLEREFQRLEPIEVPEYQREGFRGEGIALAYMISNARDQLPAGSTVSWRSDGQHISFKLTIKP